MTCFLRLIDEQDKSHALLACCADVRSGSQDSRHFEVRATTFKVIPGAPFAYWVSQSVRLKFVELPSFECDDRTARQGLATAEDFRFVRCWWEPIESSWPGFAKGGAYSRYYADVHLVVKWISDGKEIKAGICRRYPYLNGNAEFVAKNPQFYCRPGLTWPRRTTSGLSMRTMPSGCVFADKGPAAFVTDDQDASLLALLALTNSDPFRQLLSLLLAAADAAARSYEVGVVQKIPIPDLGSEKKDSLAQLARRAWSLKRKLDSVEETSHAFLLPISLRARVGDYDPQTIEEKLTEIQAEIDKTAFDLYDFTEADRNAAQAASNISGSDAADAGSDEGPDTTPPGHLASLLSWAVGVAFGRFDWRLVTGERRAPPEPEPFEPLPDKSPGMLPAKAEPLLTSAGILVDDPGHPLDLVRAVEAVLSTVGAPVEEDIRLWLRRSFFPLHLRQYSKSRRKAPIYWQLGTSSGEYTLWLYYPELTSQTLYTALNDFVEPKLQEVVVDLGKVRAKGRERSKGEDRALERLERLEQELMALRELLLELAPSYKPHHDDGVQITASPLADLFPHKPWQNVLKDTWKKLEDGEYDWAQLAMEYWPDRVREKCKSDKSVAIAHGFEDLYEGDQ